MKELREIIPENIVALRKKQGMTQVDLAKKINYSDKAVSRWEKGEVLPDIETLQALSRIFNVSLSYLLEEHYETKIEKTVGFDRNEIMMHLFTVLIIWTIATILFVYIQLSYLNSLWQLFVWAVPVTACYMLYVNKKRKNKVVQLVFRTIFIWSLLTSIYLYFIEYNAWLMYIIGIPVQATIILSYFTKPKYKG